MKRRVKISQNTFINLDSNSNSCSTCNQRNAIQNYCNQFRCGLVKVKQLDGSFKPNRCEECQKAELKFDSKDQNIQLSRFCKWLPRYKKAKEYIEKVSKSEFGEI